MRKPKEYKAFEDLVKQVLAVPKKEIDRREVEYRSLRNMTKTKPLSRRNKNIKPQVDE